MRWRPPTRPLILIALLLLAGAVVNVAVAWVLVGAPEAWTPGGPKVLIAESIKPGQLRALTTRLGAQPGWPAIDGAFAERGLGWTVHRALVTIESHRTGPSWVGEWPVMASGRAAHCVHQPSWSGGSRNSWSLESPDECPPLEFTGGRVLALTPIPAGFAINTLFYTAILALPLSFFPIRRHLRARRGRCPKCGYDLAGLGGADRGRRPPCPECGAAR
jgi:hypothetical protein